MNLLLVNDQDFVSEDRVCIRDSKRLSGLAHKPLVMRQNLAVGKVNGKLGVGTVLKHAAGALELELKLDKEPPAPLPVILLLALPRPKMLRRALRCAAEMGIKSIYLINSYLVQKSYWKSPLLSQEKMNESLLDGLAQSRDTRLPTVELENRFRPFVEDRLPSIVHGHRRLLAHPAATTSCPQAMDGRLALAIGPEGGFIDFEVSLLENCGFQPVTLGPRILRVETALPFLLGRLSSIASHVK